MLRLWPAIGLLLVVAAGVPSVDLSSHTSPDLRAEALDLAYNLDHEAAMERLRRAVAAAPSDPAPRRTLASVLWLNILFSRGAVTADHYLGRFTRTQVALKEPPEHLASEFKRNLAEALALARPAGQGLAA